MPTSSIASSQRSRSTTPIRFDRIEGFESIPDAKGRKFTYLKTSPNPKTVIEKISLYYYRFCMITGSAMLDPWERYSFNFLVVGFFALVFYNLWIYLGKLLNFLF